MQEEVLASIEASSARRWTGIGMLATVGALVIYVALASPPQIGWQIFLIVVGGGAFWQAHRMWHSTQDRIELTQSELRTSSGQVICKVEDVETVDRGVFAFKPSNGFIIKTRTPGSFDWFPGLWWRIGRRIGIGGVTAAAETKFMSEMMSAMLAQRG
ncbi:hypothetical protein [uncultured Ruegeria sp.]|uniref:hypothetical protein n=1 Tax=uncultured Ruegeria sp. TaxID=259304 RepID=UPI00261D9B48|nr:hypothetical protein [uncultured Ruegeria sp.]